MRSFLGISLTVDPVPDATALLKFRRLLETNDRCATLFETINTHIQEQGRLMREGTLIDSTILHAPSSTKNREKARDPEMHQIKKGNQWYFGMKARIGTDRDSGLVHTVVATAATVPDISQAAELLPGNKQQVHADAGYVRVEKREEIKAEIPTGGLDWQIAQRRKPVKDMEDGPEKDRLLGIEKGKSPGGPSSNIPFTLLRTSSGIERSAIGDSRKTDIHSTFSSN